MGRPASVSSPTLAPIEAVLRGRTASQSPADGPQPASVFVPFAERDGEAMLVLTRRSQEVRRHKGEIAFPGGIREPADASARETALRETVEELGVAASKLTVWGELEPVETSTGYVLSIFTGRLDGLDGLRPNRREIAEVIPVPIAVLLDESAARNETRLVAGRLMSRPSYSYNGNVIWGATARIVAQLVALLSQPGARRHSPPQARREPPN